MTITKLDNIFNLIAQAMPELKFYHMGFLLDINDCDFRNNFNAPTGAANEVLTRQMPAVYFTPPNGQFKAGLKKDPSKNQYQIELYFVDLQRRGNEGQQTGQNLSEQCTELQGIAERFLNVFQLVLKGGRYARPIDIFNFDMNAYSFKEKLVWVSYRFSMPLSGAECIDIDNIDIDAIIGEIDNQAGIDTDSLENNF